MAETIVPPDIRFINPKDKIHVYVSKGHGCVFHTPVPPSKQTTIVPRGIIWIESVSSGNYCYLYSIVPFFKEEVKDFIQRTPMPTDDRGRSSYQSHLEEFMPGTVRVRFPGQEIGNGRNNLFMIYPSHEMVATSGIFPMYTDTSLTSEEYNTYKSVSDTNTLLKEDIDFMYERSVYPTKEEAWDLYSNGNIKDIKFETVDWFNEMNKRPFTKTNHIVIINSTCRADCDAKERVNGAGPVRTLSRTRVATNVGTRKLKTLVKTTIGRTTKLIDVAREGYWSVAHEIIRRLDEMGYSPKQVSDYINTIPYTGLTALDYSRIKPKTLNSEQDFLNEQTRKKLVRLLILKGARKYTVGQKSIYLLKALQENSDNNEISQIIINGISDIIDSNEDVDGIVAAGGISIVQSTFKTILDRHMAGELTSRDLCAHTLYLLRELTISSPEGQREIIETGGVPMVLQLLHIYDDRIIAFSVFQLFRNIATSSEGRDAIFSAGGVEAVVPVLEKNLGFFDAINSGFELLCNLTEKRECVPPFIATNGVELVINALKKYEIFDVICKYGSCILRNTSATSDGPKVILDAGGIPVVLSILKTYIDDESICESILHVLVNILSLSEGRPAFMAAGGAVGGLPLIQGVRIKHAKSSTINALCTNIVKRLGLVSTLKRTRNNGLRPWAPTRRTRKALRRIN